MLFLTFPDCRSDPHFLGGTRRKPGRSWWRGLLPAKDLACKVPKVLAYVRSLKSSLKLYFYFENRSSRLCIFQKYILWVFRDACILQFGWISRKNSATLFQEMRRGEGVKGHSFSLPEIHLNLGIYMMKTVMVRMMTMMVRYCDQQFIKAAQQEFAAAADLTNEQVFQRNKLGKSR